MAKRQRVHTFTRADLAMSDRLGIEARALCGVWVDVDAAGQLGDDPAGTSDNGCARCAASVRRIIRESVTH